MGGHGATPVSEFDGRHQGHMIRNTQRDRAIPHDFLQFLLLLGFSLAGIPNLEDERLILSWMLEVLPLLGRLGGVPVWCAHFSLFHRAFRYTL